MNSDRWQDIIKIVGVCSIVTLASVSLQALAQSVSSQERILFVSEWEGKEEIYVMDSDGSDVQRLTATKAGTGSWQPVWSPDGRRTAFGSDRDGNNEIYVMNADGFDLPASEMFRSHILPLHVVAQFTTFAIALKDSSIGNGMPLQLNSTACRV